MPTISLPEALRYFFAPFVIGFYYCVYDPETAKDLVKSFGTIPAIASLVAGTAVYYLYRYGIYNDFVMPFYDLVRRKHNHRIFIKERYKIGGSVISSTRMANKIIHELSDNANYSAVMKQRARPMRSGGVHMLYQAGGSAFVFALFSFLSKGNLTMGLMFLLLAILQMYVAGRMDFEYEDEELIVVKSMLSELDQAAKPLGFAPDPPIVK